MVVGPEEAVKKEQLAKDVGKVEELYEEVGPDEVVAVPDEPEFFEATRTANVAVELDEKTTKVVRYVPTCTNT